MADPLSYLDEVLAEADAYMNKGDNESGQKAASDTSENERLADFLDKVAEALEKEDTFDEESMSLFVGENANEDTLKLRERVKNRIQQLGSMGIPG